jgi:AAA ATPase domain
MDPNANPYRPGAGTAPPALVGRDQLIEQFAITLQRALSGRPGKSVMPIGLRGVGKTVLLNRFQQTGEGLDMRVGFIEAEESGAFPRKLAIRLRAILLELERSGVSRAALRALGVLKGFAYTLPDGSAISIDVDAIAGAADSGILSEDITELFVAVGEAAKEGGTGVLLAIDEVQYLGTEELGALVSAIHRTGQLDLPVVLVGAGLPQLPGLAGEARSYAERLFEFPLIGSLEGEDAVRVLRIPAQEQDVEFEHGAIEEILKQAHGYPYFLQEWGYRVWNAAGESPITRGDVVGAAGAVQNHLDENFFAVRLDRLTPAEKEYLHAMAELGPGPHRSGDIAARLGVKVESVAPRRSALIKKGMIYSPAHGDTAFTVPLFDEFMLRSAA